MIILIVLKFQGYSTNALKVITMFGRGIKISKVDWKAAIHPASQNLLQPSTRRKKWIIVE